MSIIKGIVPERCTHKIVFVKKEMKIKRLFYDKPLEKVKSVEQAKNSGVHNCVYDFPDGKIYSVSESIYEKFYSEIKELNGRIYVIPDNPVYILILSSRTEQIIDLCLKIRSMNINVDCLYGNKNDYDPESQVLIAQEKKAGTGFSDSKFDVLYYASDITNIEQPFGRIRKSGGIHFDFVDSHPNLEKHYRTRRSHYKRVGAEIFDEIFESSREKIIKSLYETY